MPDIIVVGSFVQDLAFNTPTFPKVGETRIGVFAQGPGGKGFNQAIASVRVGAETLFIGALGDDVFSDSARMFAKSEGLETEFETMEGISSGAASIIVDEVGDNQIVVALGANGLLSPEWIDRCEGRFREAKVVLCQLEANLPAMQRALEQGRKADALTILNLAPINDSFDPAMLDLATVVTPNETEFAYTYEKVTGIRLQADFFRSSDAELHALCREIGVPVVVITLGDDGSFISVADGALPGNLSLPGGFCRRFQCIEVQVKDTTGAGDAFSGGLAAGIVRYDGDLAKAIEFASVVAGLCVEKEGTAPSMPRLQEVGERLTQFE
ncbi:kinase, pfkB family [Verrucomicrobiia bacterium DG1235]|nr:kinase, pfkB family [Verrucomicrobiae bacterium DG1235]